MTLQGGSSNFNSWTVTEESAQPGSDGCWNSKVNPALVPQYPTISGGSWTVSSNQFKPDKVGWLPASVNYIRQNSPLHSNTPLIPNFPCGADVYQALLIECSNGKSLTSTIPTSGRPKPSTPTQFRIAEKASAAL